MKRTHVLQEIKRMRFKESYAGWSEGRLTQEEAARLLGVCARSFRRYMARYAAAGLEGLLDRRLEAASNRAAPADEIAAMADLYRRRHLGWNAKHFHAWYRKDGGTRSYTWVRKHLQQAGLMAANKRPGRHRKKRERWPLPGMLIHQDGSRHEWLAGQSHDLIVTLDDATSTHYAMALVAEEGTQSSFAGVKAVIEQAGVFCAFYSDRGAHYWHTAAAGGKVDKVNLTQFGRAMKHLGIEMIAAYSPEARGRSERAFATHQARLPRELQLAGVATLEAANRYLREVYMPAFNAEFSVPAREAGSAFVPWIGGDLDAILCEQFERTVSNDNCVRFEKMSLQIPADRHRCHYVKAKVRVHRQGDGTLAIFHGPRKLADYDANGHLRTAPMKQAA